MNKTCFHRHHFTKQVENEFLFVFISWLVSIWLCFYVYFFDVVRWEMNLETENICYSSTKEDDKFIKRILHVKALKIWLMKNIFWKLSANKSLAMACLQNYRERCRLQLFTKFIQTQKKCHPFLDKISILSWRLLVISSLKVSYRLNSWRTNYLQNISYLSLRFLNIFL